MTKRLLTGQETFTYSHTPSNILSDFWAWNSSDLLDNTLRGAFAEFIVATAVHADLTLPRVSWAEYDLEAEMCGRIVKIEVKSSAYLQSWEQHKLSKIVFSCAPSQAFVNQDFDGNSIRHADVYVFCVFECKDPSAADPLDLDQWSFYILPTAVLDEKIGLQKTITLPSLQRLDPIVAHYHEIYDSVAKCAAGH